MKIKKRMSRGKTFTGRIGGLYCQVVYQTSPITGNLFFHGQYDGDTVEGFVNKGEKRGTLGGFVVSSDALSRRNGLPFVWELACYVRFNGLTPPKKGA